MSIADLICDKCGSRVTTLIECESSWLCAKCKPNPVNELAILRGQREKLRYQLKLMADKFHAAYEHDAETVSECDNKHCQRNTELLKETQ